MNKKRPVKRIVFDSGVEDSPLSYVIIAVAAFFILKTLVSS